MKVSKGCKGIGRFLWLKAFTKVNIESVYCEKNRWLKRKFEFSADNGVEPEENVEGSSISEYKTGGGNANVFVAENARGEEVAIKILREESGNGKKAVKRNRKKRIRFKIETEMVVGIQDEIKGVIPIFSYGLPDEKIKKYWYAMPIAIPLEDKLKEVKSLEDKVNCVLELARTLEALHKKDIVHRDIKPKNIYFYNGKYCLGDFGLVDYPEKRNLTSLQEAVGPKATMAPEMRYNAKNADGKKADVYSLAKTLWIVLTGVDHGFEGRYEEDDAIIGLRNDKRYKKEHLVELEELLKQATEYDPSLRPSMETFVTTLEKWLEVVSNFQKSNYSEWKYLQNTQYLEGFDSEDFDNVVDGFFDMLSYLLISYFEKYEFGSRNDVLYSFSMLPPIIRYKVLSFLYKKYPDNISVIDKLVLATVKAFSVDEATEWVEREKNALIKMGTVPEKAFNGQQSVLVKIQASLYPNSEYLTNSESLLH